MAWFVSKGYEPHLYQILFHAMRTGDELTRFRNLVAGRRGGKTLSAAWETLFYALFPEVFHWHAHQQVKDTPLWIWIVTADYSAGRPALLTFRQVLDQAGLVAGVDYKENRGLRYFEFANGTLVEFKTADNPESLRGSGLDILWLDEAAFIPNNEAWLRLRPALSDKLGLSITTTTPKGKNWLYEEFWTGPSVTNPKVGSVEYVSIDSPYFHVEEWEEAARTYHPIMFKQEYMASFEAHVGLDLHGEWLHYYESSDLPVREDDPTKYDLQLFIGVDPAVSLAETADRFSMALIGVSNDNRYVYLLEQYAGRIDFPDQVQLIEEWHRKYRPQLIGVENVAYQNSLIQQLMRLSSFPPVIGQPAKGKKFERILAMSPLFKMGRVLVRADHRDFIEEWINYDSSLKNPNDDCLDAVEIALRTAGILLPDLAPVGLFTNNGPAADLDELAQRNLPGSKQNQRVDEHMGEMW